MKLLPSGRLSATILFYLIMTLGPGCYTLLEHPYVEDQPETEDFKRCSDCHTDYHDTGFFEPIYSDPWWDYYALPWWYDDVIIITDEGETSSWRTIHEKRLRHREESGMGIAPQVMPQEGDEKKARENKKEKTGDRKRVKEVPGRDKSIKKPEQPRKRETEEKKKREKDRPPGWRKS